MAGYKPICLYNGVKTLLKNSDYLGIGELRITPTSSSITPLQVKSLQSTAPLGSELITNGTFDTDLSGWTIGGGGTGWTWDSSAKASHTTGNTDTLYQAISVASGQTYYVEFVISGRTAGSITVDVNGVYIYSYGSATSFTDGTYKRSFVADVTGNANFTITPTSDFDGMVDDIAVKEITGASQVNIAWLDDDGSTSFHGRADYGLSCLFLGINAGSYNVAGSSNTAVGYYGLYSNTTGYNNTALGYQSLFSNTTGYYNTALGLNSLFSNTTGYYNTALGLNSLFSNTTGYYNTAVGTNSLYSNTIGERNTAIGHYSLHSNTTGNYNTALGYQSLYYNTTGYHNTAVGTNSLFSNTEGNYNTALGLNSLFSNTTGYDNTALGYQSLYSNTTGYRNTAVGRESLHSNTTGTSNVALGLKSLYSNTTGPNNVAVGYQSLFSNTTGYDNTALGYQSLYSNTTGYYNTAVGLNSLLYNTTGYHNTAVGHSSLFSNTEGYNNTALGCQSLYSNTEGNYNTAVGSSALYSNTTGHENTAVGYHSLYSNTTGYQNTVVGEASLNSSTTGYRNTAVGSEAGRYTSSGSNNETSSSSVYLGYDTRPSANNDTNEIVIGALAVGNGSNTVTLGNDSIAQTFLKGILTAADQSGARAYLSANQSISPSTTTKVQLNAENYDKQNEFDSTTNYRFTASVSGVYLCVAQCLFHIPEDGKRIIAKVYVNGARVAVGQREVSDSPDDSTAFVHTTVDLAANDYVELYVYHDCSTAKDLFGASYFTFMSIHKIA